MWLLKLGMIKSSIFLLSLAIVFFSSCSSIYLPNVPNTPMLTEQGELAAGAHISLKGNFSFNSAYAISNHIGVLANGAFMQNDNHNRDIKHKSIEIGGGYFDTFGPDNNRILEIYAGLGNGNSNRLFRKFDDGELVSTDEYKATYGKKFVQVNYSSKKRNSLRLFGSNFGLNYGTALRLTFAQTNRFYRNNIIQANEDNIFFEPVFFTRVVLSKQVQLQLTSGSNIGLKNRSFLNANSSVFSVGAVVNLGRKKF